ncbi:MAG: multiple sugar transport system substrate-binding protein [Pseudonocardiales bacterium]|jgi:multiple sugar transport system substrate-binding protein|nr:extracellular solute-binding protein family 1 [Pseudonocardia sp.]MDT7650329.1 multiple sugar transport system substrate-binding protein [Pseudonocardiales bacterium]
MTLEKPVQRGTGRRARALAMLAVAGLVITACSSGGGGSSGDTSTVTVTYQQFGGSHVQEQFLTGVKAEFEKANPGVTINLQPITASENDYYTKLQLQMRTPKTSPDVVYEDTFLINSDIEAGYLRPLDDQLNSWPEWNQFTSTAKGAARALDGKTYGVPDGTDTRAIWFNKEIFAKAGLPADWQPKTWDDLLTTARTIKAKVPGVIPFNIYAGKGLGEATSMQGFEMLLYGTGSTLYDNNAKKWVIGSKGFTDSLQFLKTVYDEKLGPTPQQVLDPNWNNNVSQQLTPKGQVAISVDGSWVSHNWLPGDANPWPQWNTVMGNAAMPTQEGQAPGKVSMSGGWTWAIPKNAGNPDKAWEFIKLISDRQHQLKWDIDNVQIPVRPDVSGDPTYTAANPTNEFFSSLVPITTYRPAYALYPRVSNEIQVATESVITGTADVATAAKTFDDQVRSIAGDAVMTAAGS